MLRPAIRNDFLLTNRKKVHFLETPISSFDLTLKEVGSDNEFVLDHAMGNDFKWDSLCY